MINAKEELIKHIGDRAVKHVCIAYGYFDRVRYEGSLDKVLPRLDFDYNNDSGTQRLYGHIWYEDGTWSERREDDCSEWWRHVKRPEIPDFGIDV